jgi:peroxiredoxin Q/BCP
MSPQTTPSSQATPALGRKIKNARFVSTHALSSFKDLLGSTVVLYFYPKDDTSGCTQEGLDFKALHARFKKLNAVIVGVSPDSIAAHDKFTKKHGFPFALIADEEKQLAQSFGVWVEKSMYGRRYMGIERSTFLIDAEGVLRAEWRKVKVPGHAQAVLDAVMEL